MTANLSNSNAVQIKRTSNRVWIQEPLELNTREEWSDGDSLSVTSSKLFSNWNRGVTVGHKWLMWCQNYIKQSDFTLRGQREF